MYFTKKQVYLFMILTGILLPIGIISGIALMDTNSINQYVFATMCLCTYLILFLLYQCNSWEVTYLGLRVAPIVFVTLVIGIKFTRGGFVTSIHKYDYWIGIITLLVIFSTSRILYKILMASKKPVEVLEMAFPFQKGKYLITDGGDGSISSLMNYHYKSSTHNQHGTQKSMRYAIDIVKLGTWGRTVSRSVAISDNTKYMIFHNTIVSPIDGTVIKVQDGIDNNDSFPGKGHMPYNLGNFVVIKKEDYYVIMGHMEKESIMVKEGDKIQVGDKIGLVGNSGLTPRPHLHMQVSKCEDGNYWTAQGVPVIFNNTFYPVKNRTIVVE